MSRTMILSTPGVREGGRGRGGGEGRVGVLEGGRGGREGGRNEEGMRRE